MQKKISIIAIDENIIQITGTALAAINFSITNIINPHEDYLTIIKEVKPDLIIIDNVIYEDGTFLTIADLIKVSFNIPLIILIDKEDNEIISGISFNSKKYHFVYKPLIEHELQNIIKIIFHSNSLEKKLRKTEYWFGNIIKSVGDAVIALDIDQAVTFINTEAEQITGWEYDEAIGKKCSDVFKLIHTISRAEVHNMYESVLKEGVLIGFSGEENLIDKYGTEKAIDYAMMQIYSDEDELLGVIIAFGDAMTRRLSYEHFLQSEAQFRLFVENASDMIFRLDNNFNFTYINPAVVQILGYSPEELQDKNYCDIIHAYFHDKVQGIRSLKPGSDEKEILVEYMAIHKDGKDVWISQKFQPMFENERITGFQGIARDMTARKQMEDGIRKARDAAEAANKLKSSFLANMSHELRTPLNAVIGYCQLLEMQQMGPLNEKQVEFLNIIKDAGNHLLEMVNDILDLSKIEAGKVEINKSPFDMRLMLSRAPTTIKSLADKKGVHLITEIEDDIGIVNADEIRIKQVIYNLLSNAIKFTEPKKKIGLKAYGENDKAIISVWDEGIGIEADKLETIFNPFEQINLDLRAKNKGTGLGLSISRKLIHLHGGTITVSSQLGKGSNFTITLNERLPYTVIKPDDQKIEQLPTVNNVPVNSLTRKKIMVVDDISLNRHLLEKTLSMKGYEVVSAETGEEAVEIALTMELDLIMMDIQLKDMNGVEAMKEIRKIKKDILVFAFTAYAMKGDKEKFLNYGFNGYISKPIDIEKMVESIENSLCGVNE